MINLTINKADLKRQLAAELVEIRDGDPDAVATALVFTRDDRYSIAVRVTPARSGYSVNVRTFLGGEAADGNTTLIHTVETTCDYVLEILDFVVTCAACADLDAEMDNATALAHLDAKTDAAPVSDVVKTAARNAAAELEMIADTYGVHAARACITNLGARLEADGHVLVSLRLQDIKGQSTSRYRDSVRACAAALREIAGPVEAAPVDPAGREFYVATISGVEGDQVVVDTVRAESEEAAAKVVADRVYGGDFYRGGGFYFYRGGVLTCWIATGDSDVCAPITVHAVDHELAAPMAPVRAALVCAMGDRARPTRMKPSELLAIAQSRRAAVQPGREFMVATLSGTDDMPIVVTPITLTDEIITAEGLRPCDLSHRDMGRLAARLVVRFVYDLGARVHCASTWSDKADGQYFHIFDALELLGLRIMALVSDPRPPHELADMRDTLIAAYRNNLCLAAATIQRRGQTVARERANTAPVQPGRDFLVATFSGADADPVVVTPITLTDDMITREGGDVLIPDHFRGVAARIVARSVYALQGPVSCRELWTSRKGGPVVFAVTATGLHGRLIPVLVCEPVPHSLWGTVEDSMNAVAGQYGVNVGGLLSRSRWAADPANAWGQPVATADGLTPWTVIAVYPDNGQIHGEHVMARDGSHALALVAAGMCVPDEDGTVDCDLICAIAGHVSEPNIEYAGADVVSAAQYLENHGAE